MDLLTLAGIAIRPATATDTRFVELKWLQSGEHAWLSRRWTPNHWKRWAAQSESMRRALYRKEISRTIKARGATLVAFPVDEPQFVLAWACPEFSWTRAAFRGQGIQRALRAQLG